MRIALKKPKNYSKSLPSSMISIKSSQKMTKRKLLLEVNQL
jgi:hypothetical protein